jgi:hypothetical protein
MKLFQYKPKQVYQVQELSQEIQYELNVPQRFLSLLNNHPFFIYLKKKQEQALT